MLTTVSEMSKSHNKCICRKGVPAFKLTQTIGEKGSCYACSKCVPAWVTSGKGSPFYTVTTV